MLRLLVTLVIVVVLVDVSVKKLLDVMVEMSNRLDVPFVQYNVSTRYEVEVAVFEVTVELRSVDVIVWSVPNTLVLYVV